MEAFSFVDLPDELQLIVVRELSDPLQPLLAVRLSSRAARAEHLTVSIAHGSLTRRPLRAAPS